MNAIHPDGRDLFPDLNFDEIRDVGLSGGTQAAMDGALFDQRCAVEAVGQPQLKIGADFRRLGISDHDLQRKRRGLHVHRAFTGRTGVANSGHELASALLGLPRRGTGRFRPRRARVVHAYWGAYVQDDWRVSSNFTLNYGVRFEHEDGLREIENRQTVAFDRKL